jgi:hypothetical protein
MSYLEGRVEPTKQKKKNPTSSIASKQLLMDGWMDV